MTAKINHFLCGTEIISLYELYKIGILKHIKKYYKPKTYTAFAWQGSIIIASRTDRSTTHPVILLQSIRDDSGSIEPEANTRIPVSTF